MRNASLVSVLVFLPAANVLGTYAGLVGLWWAMVVFVLARAISLLLFAPNLMHQFSDMSDQKGAGK